MTARRPGRPPGETTMSAGVSASGRASGAGQRGSVPVAVALLVAAALLAVTIAAVVPLQRRHGLARAVAGVAALQASHAQRGLVADEPCGRAQQVAAAHGATVMACDETDRGMLVTVRIDTPFGGAESTAHAGRPDTGGERSAAGDPPGDLMATSGACGRRWRASGGAD